MDLPTAKLSLLSLDVGGLVRFKCSRHRKITHTAAIPLYCIKLNYFLPLCEERFLSTYTNGLLLKFANSAHRFPGEISIRLLQMTEPRYFGTKLFRVNKKQMPQLVFFRMKYFKRTNELDCVYYSRLTVVTHLHSHSQLFILTNKLKLIRLSM